MGTIRFTDSVGAAILHNGKPHPASRFANWNADSLPRGASRPRQSDEAITMFRTSSRRAALFELPHIPSIRGNNLAKRSESLDDSYWTKSGVTAPADADTGFDGAAVADRIKEDSSTGTHYLARSSTPITITAGAVLAYSHILKAASRTWTRLRVLDGAAGTDAFGAYFDLAGGVVGTTGVSGSGTFRRAYMEPWGNGYFRCVIVGKLPVGRTSAEIRTMLASADGVQSYVGDGASYISAAGAQFEELVDGAGDIASPYLLTSSAAIAGVSMYALAVRLRYHLENGGQCAVYTGDAALSSYATCGIVPGVKAGLSMTDRTVIEHTLALQLINLAASPADMLCYYAEQ